jgi:antitoxin (DNA-binding transcriptional repressor) of toxin-antitoxin stability system
LIVNRVSVAEVARDFPNVLRRVTGQGESLALEEASRIVAWLTPPEAHRECSVTDLERLLSSMPELGDDLEAFAQDFESANAALAPERSRWD